MWSHADAVPLCRYTRSQSIPLMPPSHSIQLCCIQQSVRLRKCEEIKIIRKIIQTRAGITEFRIVLIETLCAPHTDNTRWDLWWRSDDVFRTSTFTAYSSIQWWNGNITIAITRHGRGLPPWSVLCIEIYNGVECRSHWRTPTHTHCSQIERTSQWLCDAYSIGLIYYLRRTTVMGVRCVRVCSVLSNRLCVRIPLLFIRMDLFIILPVFIPIHSLYFFYAHVGDPIRDVVYSYVWMHKWVPLLGWFSSMRTTGEATTTSFRTRNETDKKLRTNRRLSLIQTVTLFLHLPQ